MSNVFLEITTGLVKVDCCNCGGTFAINARYDQEKREQGGGFHCPYCQSQLGYWESEIKRLQKKLSAEQQRVIAEQNRTAAERARHDQTRADLRETEQRRRAEKGAKTRIKNRIANGCCPCCNRYFKDLHRHMTSQHPDFQSADA